MNKPVHFKDEIRQSFFSYSLIPAVIFAVAVITVTAGVWNWTLYKRADSENRKISQSLNRAVNAYKNQVAQEFPVAVSSLHYDSEAVSLVYSMQKSCILKQGISADFAVLSPSYEVLLQGSSGGVFCVPAWQDQFYWGALGRMESSPGKTIIEISSDYNTEGLPEIVIGRAILENGNVGGYLIYTISGDAARKQLHTAIPFAVADVRGVFFTGSDSRYEDQLEEIPLDYRRKTGYFFSGKEAVCRTATPDGLFAVYTFSDTEQLQQTILSIFFMIIAVLILVIRGLFLSAEKISEEKSETIDKIVDAYKEVEKGNLDRHLSVDSNIEFQTIADAYNEMLANVKRLIEENNRETQEKYIAELKQLEMQFNPHFLYNTLENIKFLIKLDPDKAQKTILCLSELLRYSINNELTVMPVDEDIHYIENYLYILKMRFGSRFEYTIDIPVSVQKYLIPKLILQPLIGNSVKYGFESCEHMEIWITARAAGGKLWITVKDNGSGIEKEHLKEIRQLLKSESNETRHIGLYNVQRRIQLMYGEMYGLKLESSKGEGTAAKIVLPCVRGDIK